VTLEKWHVLPLERVMHSTLTPPDLLQLDTYQFIGLTFYYYFYISCSPSSNYYIRIVCVSLSLSPWSSGLIR